MGGHQASGAGPPRHCQLHRPRDDKVAQGSVLGCTLGQAGRKRGQEEAGTQFSEMRTQGKVMFLLQASGEGGAGDSPGTVLWAVRWSWVLTGLAGAHIGGHWHMDGLSVHGGG